MKLLTTLLAFITTLACQAVNYTNIVNPPSMVSLAWNASPNPNWGVNLYTGSQPRNYTNITVVGRTNFVVVPIQRGVQYYFAITYNYAGLESDFSSELAFINTNTVPTPPTGFLTPVLLQVQYKNNLQDFMWADSNIWWSLDPRETNQFFRLNLVQSGIVRPSITPHDLPPLPK